MSDREYVRKLEDHARDIMNSPLEIMDLLDDKNRSEERACELERTIASHGPEGRNYTNLQYVVLRNENARLREALEFYADPNSYSQRMSEPFVFYRSINEDNGDRARRALKGESE